MKRGVSLIVLIMALLMTFAAVAPVLAIGPWEAVEVGNNPNLLTILGALKNDRGKAVGVVEWFEASGVWMKMSFFDTVSGQGKANNAITATISTVMQFYIDFHAYMDGKPTVNENKWIILSPEGSGNQYQFPDTPQTHNLYLLGSHGMIWWLLARALKGKVPREKLAGVSLVPNKRHFYTYLGVEPTMRALESSFKSQILLTVNH